MPVGFGVQGTSSEDIQSITDALYTPGIISGAVVSTTTDTNMTYTVTAGVVCIKMASGLSILAPVPAIGLIDAAPAPASGTRVDKIYVEQTFGTTPDIIVGVTSGTVPPNSLVLKSYSVPAGATNTNGATQIGGINYSVPYGATGRSLWEYENTHKGNLDTTNRIAYGSLYLPTDRSIDIEISSTFDVSQGADASVYFQVDIDGVREVTMGTGKLTAWYTTYFHKHNTSLSAGQHTIRIEIEGSGKGEFINIQYGGSTARPGIVYKVRDAGVVV